MSGSPEDKRLWRAVARTVTPPKRRQDGSVQSADLAAEMASLMGSGADTSKPVAAKRQPMRQVTLPLSANPSATANPPQHPIEKRVLKNLAKGRRTVDARVDLHGYTQDRARAVLLGFLEDSVAAGHRIVLVITGKGNDGTGVLRRNVPLWLDTQPFARLVNGREKAHVSHGGEGALYVRLRRR